jgi:ethanolamine transporter EutH
VRYTVRRISLASVARLGCLLSGLVTLPSALCLAGLTVALLQRIHQALQQVEPLTVSLLGQELVRLDLLEALHLQPLANRVTQWTQDSFLTFASLTLIFVLIGGLLVTASVALTGIAYNLLAQVGWGLTLELSDEQRSSVGQ